MPGKKPIKLRPAFFNWHMNTLGVRHSNLIPLINDIRRYPLIRALEKALSSKVNQGKISNDLAGRFFRELIIDISKRVYDIEVDSKKIEKVRRESKTPSEEMRGIVHLAIEEGAIPKSGLYFSVKPDNVGLEGYAKMVDKTPVIKLFMKLKGK